MLALAALAACTPAPTDYGGATDRASRRAALVAAQAFAAVLSERAEPETLSGYDLVILDPDPYDPDDLAVLRERGVLTLGYVNIGELEDWRSFAERVDPAWVLGENPNWPGHQFVDARQPGWQALVVDEIAARVVASEFDGLFLDMADVAAPSLYPDTAEGVVAVIRALRARYPTHLLVLNRGLFLLDEVGEALDGLLVEGVWARLDLAAGTTIRTPASETAALLRRLDAFRQSTGGAVFAIDYADTDDLRDYVTQSARRARLPVFIGTAALADLSPTDRLGW